ncbi:unnamed protein product [Mytilus coruscus]|uniref:Uncharacterized protein n=1 Tax=Mytilus coruscus TaxID=42192 RepID=A0A6J7ZVC4_MYTCO|nr:unnamed protein product [Mytilus coruscus]
MDVVMDNMASSKTLTFITSGSFGEGLELRGSDVDMMYVFKRLENVYHDAVSGWLMLASFFYKTKQYSNALHIIRYSLSKCTPEKLYQNMIMSDIHYQLLKLQFFQKKRFCYLLEIMFVDKIQLRKNSTLLPDELQMDGSNDLYYIPSGAYTYFFNFLCNYHLHNVKQCQNSLHGLQLVVDEHYLSRGKLCQGAAFEILGVALQLSGDKESARIAFLQSAKLTK